MKIIRRKLHYGDGNELLGYTVVKDQKYAGMWRIRFPDGALSDFANFTRTRYKLKGYLAGEKNNGLEDPESLVHALKYEEGRKIARRKKIR